MLSDKIQSVYQSTHRMCMHKFDMVFELGAHFEASVTYVTFVRSVLAVVLEMRAHAPSCCVRLATQRTLKLLNAYIKTQREKSPDANRAWNILYVFWTIQE